MASIPIRNLDDEVKTRLRARAAEHHRSMEEETRLILRDAVGREPSSLNLASIVRSHFRPANGVDLELLPREPEEPRPSIESTGDDRACLESAWRSDARVDTTCDQRGERRLRDARGARHGD